MLFFLGVFRIYVVLVILYSSLVCLGHLVFQLYLLFYKIANDQDYGQFLDGNCE